MAENPVPGDEPFLTGGEWAFAQMEDAVGRMGYKNKDGNHVQYRGDHLAKIKTLMGVKYADRKTLSKAWLAETDARMAEFAKWWPVATTRANVADKVSQVCRAAGLHDLAELYKRKERNTSERVESLLAKEKQLINVSAPLTPEGFGYRFLQLHHARPFGRSALISLLTYALAGNIRELYFKCKIVVSPDERDDTENVLVLPVEEDGYFMIGCYKTSHHHGSDVKIMLPTKITQYARLVVQELRDGQAEPPFVLLGKHSALSDSIIPGVGERVVRHCAATASHDWPSDVQKKACNDATHTLETRYGTYTHNTAHEFRVQRAFLDNPNPEKPGQRIVATNEQLARGLEWLVSEYPVPPPNLNVAAQASDEELAALRADISSIDDPSKTSKARSRCSSDSSAADDTPEPATVVAPPTPPPAVSRKRKADDTAESATTKRPRLSVRLNSLTLDKAYHDEVFGAALDGAYDTVVDLADAPDLSVEARKAVLRALEELVQW